MVTGRAASWRCDVRRSRPTRRTSCTTSGSPPVRPLSPSFVRVTFTGPDLDRVADSGLDQRFKLILPLGEWGLDLVGMDDDWYTVWREQPDDRRNPVRTYTVRAVRQDVRELDVDVVRHGPTGPAGAWIDRRARSATRRCCARPNRDFPGDPGGRGLRAARVAYDRLLLAGDETAVPAISSIIDGLPAGTRATVVVEVPQAAATRRRCPQRRRSSTSGDRERRARRTPRELRCIAGPAAREPPRSCSADAALEQHLDQPRSRMSTSTPRRCGRCRAVPTTARPGGAAPLYALARRRGCRDQDLAPPPGHRARASTGAASRSWATGARVSWRTTAERPGSGARLQSRRGPAAQPARAGDGRRGVRGPADARVRPVRPVGARSRVRSAAGLGRAGFVVAGLRPDRARRRPRPVRPPHALDRHLRGAGALAGARDLPGAVRRPAGSRAHPRPATPRMAALGRLLVGGRGSRARTLAVRGLHLGAGGVQPGRRTRPGPRRPGRSAAHDLRGRTGRRPAGGRGRGRGPRPRTGGRCGLRRCRRGRWRSACSIPTARQAPSDGQAPPLFVALIQGNVPRLGLDFNAQREAVLRNHVAGTEALAAAVAAGEQPQPDLVIWPENASDIDPFRNAEAAELIQGAVDDIGVPILVGAVIENPADPSTLLNVGIVWEPATATSPGGPGETYVKQHPVPFAEYMPYRSFVRLVSQQGRPGRARLRRPVTSRCPAGRAGAGRGRDLLRGRLRRPRPLDRRRAAPSCSWCRPTTPPSASPTRPSSSWR